MPGKGDHSPLRHNKSTPPVQAHTVPKAVWKILKYRNFSRQHEDSAGSRLENFYSATSKEEVPLAYGKISLQ
jgi:hypothetical protein